MTALKVVEWPALYLDFETVTTALPLYDNIAPYVQVPTQYSVHKCMAAGKVVSHKEYLADPTIDGRRQLTEQLIADLEGAGSIITYSSFEKTLINNLAILFPELAVPLTSLVNRMVDLEALIRENFYHPAFHGSTSVKVTLPVMVPDMSYEGLGIQDGDSANATFAYLARGRYSQAEAEIVKADLLEYCAQDTMAMVKLHEQLSSLA